MANESELVKSDRERLETLRDQLETALTACETREIASIAKQYRDTIAELSSLPGTSGQDPLERIQSGAAGGAITPNTHST